MTFEEELNEAQSKWVFSKNDEGKFTDYIMSVIDKWTWRKPVVDGELVKPGDVLYGKSDGKEWVVKEIGFYGDESHGGKYPTRYQIMGRNDTGKQPLKASWMTRTPKAIASDGRHLEVGQTVYDINEGHEMKVTGFNKNGWPFVTDWVDGEEVPFDPSELTHTKPVFDADGVVIREGDTVYSLLTGNRIIVESICVQPDPDKSAIWSTKGRWSYPKQVTHRLIDTLERIREDMGMSAMDYCRERGMTAPNWEVARRSMMEDLVDRAMEIEERGE